MTIQQWAERLAALVVEHPDAPEGIELFRWYWVPASWQAFRFPLAVEGQEVTAAPPPPRATLPPVGEIAPRLHFRHSARWTAGVGWDRWERRAVLFFAGGGDLKLKAPTPVETDAVLRSLACGGHDLLRREAAARFRALLDELSLSEGEESKRPPPS